MREHLTDADSEGRPLPGRSRRRLESGFGVDLSDIRLHVGPDADGLLRDHRARALTVGPNIYLSGELSALSNPIAEAILAHEVAHTLQQRGAAHGEVRSGGAMDEVMATHAAAHAVARGFGAPRSAPTVASTGGLRMQACSEDQGVRKGFDDAIQTLGEQGMPVGFLDEVSANFEFFSASSNDGVQPVLDNVLLQSTTLDNLSDAARLDELGMGAVGVQTIFHEGTHAYTDLMASDPAWAAFIAGGEAHYAGAPLEGGGTANGYRLFQEAIGGYVGNRASSWWSTLNALHVYAAMLDRGEVPAESAPRLRDMVQDLRDTYDRKAAERVFGYEPDWWGSQLATTRPMSEDMVDFLEEQVLEGRLPRTFDAEPKFTELEADILRRLDLLEAGAWPLASPPGPQDASPE